MAAPTTRAMTAMTAPAMPRRFPFPMVPSSPAIRVMALAQLRARVDASALAPQPLAVEQLRPSQLRTQLGAAQPIDGFAIQAVGGGAVAQQRPGACFDAEGEIVAAGLGRLREPLEGVAGELGVSSARGRLDELGQRPNGYKDLEGARG